MKLFHDAFYQKPERICQDNFILKHCKVRVCARHRPRTNSGNAKTLTYNYFIRTADKKTVKVCREAFLTVLDLKKDLVQNVLKVYHSSGQQRAETRGSDRKSEKFLDRTNFVISFIKKFKSRESHYTRAKTKRKYLPSELSVCKMWRMYQAQSP